jgi:hypothetical protein
MQNKRCPVFPSLILPKSFPYSQSMRISEQQLDEYIALYQSEYGEVLERSRAIGQVHKLVNLVLYMALAENELHALEQSLETEYNKDATLMLDDAT